jgi:hypothetical protein
MRTASYYEVRTVDGSDYCVTLGLAHDVADALDVRGIGHTIYVHFTDRTFKRLG